MPTIWKALALAAAVVLTSAQAAPEQVEYTLTPVMRGGAMTAMQIDVRFRGEADGETGLRLPDEWGGQRELWRALHDVRVVSGGALREDTSARRIIAHRPNARIHVRYRVEPETAEDPNARDGNAYRPVIRPTYFHLIGHAVLAMPEINNETPVVARVRNLRRGWSFASDLEHGALTLDTASESVSVGGDYRVLRDGQTRVAIRGAWSFSDADFMSEVATIISGQRRFWGDDPEPYLVTVTQLVSPQEGWSSTGGTGLSDAFAFFATPNGAAETITRTLAHEGMHTWIPLRIGGVPQEGQIADYWLSEGFTDFYTGRVLVREGLWTPAQFAADFNRVLDEYARLPVRNEPNRRVVADFWNSRDVQRLPYLRGHFLAWRWDARLRGAGRDFDDVMANMRTRANAGGDTTAAQIFRQTANDLGLDVADDLAIYVEDGASIMLPEDTFGVCGRVTTRQVPNFHRGFDIEATQANSNVITGVDPALPAYAAGLRDGMVLVRRDGGEIGNAAVEIGYVVRDGETERTIRYMPRGVGAYTAQRLELAPLEGAALAQCVAVIGGA